MDGASTWYASEYMIMSYDAVQLNRIECMLTQLMTMLFQKEERGSMRDTLAGFGVLDLSVTGSKTEGAIVEDEVSKSKQRRVRATRTKKSMWSRLHSASQVEVDKLDCDIVADDVDAGVNGRSLEDKADDVSADAKTDEMEETLSCRGQESDGSIDIHRLVGMEGYSSAACAAKLPDATVHEDAELVDKPDYGSVVERLRGKCGTERSKSDAVMNLLLNRKCVREDYKATLECLRKYFKDDTDRTADFLGVKFGTGWKSWDEVEDGLQIEIAGNIKWDPGLTLGMVLAELRRKKSEVGPRGSDQATQRVQRLNQPRKSKHKGRK